MAKAKSPVERALFLGADVLVQANDADAAVVGKVIALYPSTRDDETGVVQAPAMMKLVLFDPMFGVQFSLMRQDAYGSEPGHWAWLTE